MSPPRLLDGDGPVLNMVSGSSGMGLASYLRYASSETPQACIGPQDAASLHFLAASDLLHIRIDVHLREELTEIGPGRRRVRQLRENC